MQTYKAPVRDIRFSLETMGYDKLNKFYDSLKPFYFNSKLFYLERDKTYKNFITILRQITKYHHIPYTSKIIYLKSTYEIKYFISLH